MKSFFKKIALVLTLAMVIGLVPVNTASAAATPGLKYSSKILYVDGDASGKYDDWCWTPSENTKGYDVSYNVKSGSDLVEVAENGKITATGNAVGKAVVEVTYTSQNSGSSKTANFTVYVKQNATKVKLVNATQEALKEALMVGAEVTLKAAKTATDYKKGNYGLDNYTKVITDLIRITSDNEEVVKVEGNKLTAVGGGTANVIVETYQKEGNVVTATASYPVVVKDDTISSVTQISYDTFNLGFGFEAKDTVKKEDITVKNAEGIIQPISEITWDSTGKIATVKMYLELVNDTVYTVTYQEKTLEFKASVGEVAQVVIIGTDSGNLIADNESTTLNYKLYDANGIEVSKGANAWIEFAIVGTNNYAWIDGENITVFEIGQKVDIKAIYHTGTYNLTTGDEYKVESAPFTLTCVDTVAPTATGTSAYTISQKQKDDADWTNLNKNVSLSDQGSYYLSVKVNLTNGKTAYANEFTSTDTNKLLIDATTGQLYPVAAGTVSVICKYGNYTTVVTVNVTTERKAASISADRTSIVLTNSEQLDDSATVTLTVRDQYGAELPAENVDVDKISSTTNEVTFEKENGKVTFKGKKVPAGTYTYKLTTQGKTVVVTITVKAPNNSLGSIKFAASNIDTKVVSGEALKTMNISVTQYDTAGTKVSLVSNYKPVITLNGKEIDKAFVKDDSNGTITISAAIVTEGAIKKLQAGTYQVTGKDANGKNIVATSFVVSDSTAAINVKYPAVTAVVGIGANEEEIKNSVLTNCFEVTSDAFTGTQNIQISELRIVGDTSKAGKISVLVQKIHVTDTVNVKDSGETTIKYEVTVNKPVTVTVQ